jgi:hypothetical protein
MNTVIIRMTVVIPQMTRVIWRMTAVVLQTTRRLPAKHGRVGRAATTPPASRVVVVSRRGSLGGTGKRVEIGRQQNTLLANHHQPAYHEHHHENATKPFHARDSTKT